MSMYDASRKRSQILTFTLTLKSVIRWERTANCCTWGLFVRLSVWVRVYTLLPIRIKAPNILFSCSST